MTTFEAMLGEMMGPCQAPPLWEGPFFHLASLQSPSPRLAPARFAKNDSDRAALHPMREGEPIDRPARWSKPDVGPALDVQPAAYTSTVQVQHR
jgi:hypothetical protein